MAVKSKKYDWGGVDLIVRSIRRSGEPGAADVGRHIIADAATVTLTRAQTGAFCIWDKVDGATFQLPASEVGLEYEFHVLTASTSVGQKILTPASSFFTGSINQWDTDGDTKPIPDTANAAEDDVFTFDGTTQGGIAGSWIKVVCISSTLWYVQGLSMASGSVTTSFTTT